MFKRGLFIGCLERHLYSDRRPHRSEKNEFDSQKPGNRRWKSAPTVHREQIKLYENYSNIAKLNANSLDLECSKLVHKNWHRWSPASNNRVEIRRIRNQNKRSNRPDSDTKQMSCDLKRSAINEFWMLIAKLSWLCTFSLGSVCLSVLLADQGIFQTNTFFQSLGLDCSHFGIHWWVRLIAILSSHFIFS